MQDSIVQYENLFASRPFIRGKTPSPFALEALQYASGKTVLDLGCGEGQDAIAFAKYGFNVKAIDTSRSAISHAKDLAQTQRIKINWLCNNVLDLDTWKGKYDLIFTDGFLHFFGNDTLRRIIETMQARTHLYGINAIGVFDRRTTKLEQSELETWGIHLTSPPIIEALYDRWILLKIDKPISERGNGEIRGISHWIYKKILGTPV
ncbi:MAG: class I SAM-dependent methyltransferase [Anaerolineae bacterium]|nr:class I SAM-dependent methyltransferase [Anaerolineae bacterium]